MNEVQARKVAKKIVEYLFSDGTNRKVNRLMMVFEGQSFPNAGWGNKPIEDIITEKILQEENNAITQDKTKVKS